MRKDKKAAKENEKEAKKAAKENKPAQ